MKNNIYNYIYEKVSKFKYTSMYYLDYEDIKDYEVVKDNENIIGLYGYDVESKMNQYHWATNDVLSLINSIEINGNLLLTFIPKEWVPKLKENGFDIFAKWNDYFNNSLENIDDKACFEIATLEDCEKISDVTLACQGQSRGFTGQTKEWVEEWIKCDENGQSEIKDNAIIIRRDNCKSIIGIVCTAVYGHESEKGPIVWIRELAVKPQYQNQGIGRNLINNALSYGKSKGATRAFLHADECNINAIHLYESIGFVGNKGDAQIDMWRR